MARHALPLWCCLSAKSKLVLLKVLKEQGETHFDEPQPVWVLWLPDYKPKPFVIADDTIDYDKFMREKPQGQVKVS